jgi:hypothetical protein
MYYNSPAIPPPRLSQDARIVLALGRTSLPFATCRTQEAERWLRVLRMHGHVGAALQSLGVPERRLEGASDAWPAQGRWEDGRRHDATVARVCCSAVDFARQSGAKSVGTVHILFAVLAIYGWAFDHELYRRGTCRDEVFAALAGEPLASVVEA